MELEIFSTSDNPFITPLYYAFQDSDNLYLSLKYCPGGELFNLLGKQNFFTEEVARFYAAQVLLALEYLHTKNYVYIDLKPENILIDSNGYIKLTDFGLSRRLKNGIAGHNPSGTLEYMSPEMFSGNGYGIATDWYALGCLIFEMITGNPPFRSQNQEKLIDKILTQEPNFPTNMSKSLIDLLKKLLNKDPKSRLGMGKTGPAEIKSHPWFSGVRWNLLVKQKLKAPFVPELRYEADLSHFDSCFKNKSLECLTPKSSKTFELPGFEFCCSPKKSYTKPVF